jgi:hypothetical protein
MAKCFRMPGKMDPAKSEIYSNGTDGKEGTKDDVTYLDMSFIPRPSRPFIGC